MLSMGILPGTPVKLVRRLPAKGSVYVEAGGRNFALRYREAHALYVRSL